MQQWGLETISAIDQWGTTKMAEYKLEIYKDKRGGNLWRCFSTANKKQVGKSTEAFKSPADCKANARMNGYKG